MDDHIGAQQEWLLQIGRCECVVDDEDRAGLTEDIERDLSALEGEYQQLEIALTLGGPYDQRNALVSIHAREGGTAMGRRSTLGFSGLDFFSLGLGFLMIFGGSGRRSLPA